MRRSGHADEAGTPAAIRWPRSARSTGRPPVERARRHGRWSGASSVSLGPADPGDKRTDHREMRPDMAVQILVRPAEACRIEPFGLGHRPDGGLEASSSGDIRRQELLARIPAAGSHVDGIPGGDAGTGHLLPAATPAVLHQRVGRPVEPRCEMADMIGDGPGLDDAGGGPGVGRNARDRLVEQGEDRCRVGPEAADTDGKRARPGNWIRPEWVVLDLPGSKAVGPRLEDPQVVDRVAVEDVVDPAPGDVAADRWQWQGPDAFEKGVPTEPRGGPQLGRRATGAGLPAALVERVEVAALVILVGRPAAGGDRPIDVLDADLEPVDDVGDVIEERPVRPTGVRGSRAGQSPGGIVEPGPRRREAVPHGRF